MARIGDIPKAIEAFKEVVTIEPNNLDGLICLASVMWQVSRMHPQKSSMKGSAG